jgi:ABC-type bacteriocin/lantibiotic exporter with double-glycine peptidase domain
MTPFGIEREILAKWPKNILAFMLHSSLKKQIIVSIIALIVAVLSVAPIELQRRIVNEALEKKDLDLLLVMGGLFIIALLAQQFAKYFLGTYQNWIGQSAILTVRKLLFKQAKTKKGDEAEKTGNAASVIGAEIDHVGEFVGTGISDLVADGGKLIFAIGYMIYIDPRVALVALAFFVPQIFIVPFLQAVLNLLIRQRTDLLRDISDLVVDDGRTGEADFKETALSTFENRAKSRSVKFLTKAIVNTINALAPLSVLVFGGYMYMQGQTSIGTIVAFMSGFERMSGPMRALVGYYRLASLRNEQYLKIADWSERRAT